MNPTRVTNIFRPTAVTSLQHQIKTMHQTGASVCTAGGRHAMGGQQFATNTLLIDTSGLNRVLDFDREQGLITVEAGIQWPALVNYLTEQQAGVTDAWGIRQKPTGTDSISLGGSMSANAHGRGLGLSPIVQDIERFTLINAQGRQVTCSRSENPDLFRLAIGGYGLFGVISDVTLRLSQREKIRRDVRLLPIEAVVPAFDEALANGYCYGDYQFAIDPNRPDFLKTGIFSIYKPVSPDTPIPDDPKKLTLAEWANLVYLAHTDKSLAFEQYADHYLKTHGQIYWSDTHQLSTYSDSYHDRLNQRMGLTYPATEMITELYVPRHRLPELMTGCSTCLRAHDASLIYGTVRLIEPDRETFLPWAKDRYACVIFNLHTPHTPLGIAQATQTFRQLIDNALDLGGSYYLTYHRYATRQQVERAYPQFQAFLRLKQQYDPAECFQSTWYRHYKRLFA